jgi:stage IV sporulation protein FB
LTAWTFSLFGFRVRVQPFFWLLPAIFMLSELQAQSPLIEVIAWPFILLVSIIGHELGHAFVARRFGLRVGDIELHGLGGHVTHPRTTPRRQLAISLAGPFAGFTMAGLMLLLLATPIVSLTAHGLRSVLQWFAIINVFWSVFNLLPMYPLDGGHALKSTLDLFTNQVTSWRVTAGLGAALGATAAVLGFQGGEVFLAFIGGMAAWQNLQILQQVR